MQCVETIKTLSSSRGGFSSSITQPRRRARQRRRTHARGWSSMGICIGPGRAIDPGGRAGTVAGWRKLARGRQAGEPCCTGRRRGEPSGESAGGWDGRESLGAGGHIG
ncbi:hypothetical protein BO99DRAFT_258623 [Aspergillus violaceofuscus CBS 115571]|uniref:Uncharacterized protein n=1 Tax=Aspergillus violaceofuscus (strain CBS 115571) TaxID=1450538 RepID=A0A2V5IFF8_ASPV1|nr:hypothetical protein BO99DRAFT_258623 [Aspergillus violaceofuscus CBS 115571]